MPIILMDIFAYENAASLVLGTILLIVGLGMIFSAIHKMLDPSIIPDVHSIALLCGFIGISG